jgi:hypothetical protein
MLVFSKLLLGTLRIYVSRSLSIISLYISFYSSGIFFYESLVLYTHSLFSMPSVFR